MSLKCKRSGKLTYLKLNLLTISMAEEDNRYETYIKYRKRIVKLGMAGKISDEKAGKLLTILDLAYEIGGEPLPKLEDLLKMKEDKLDELWKSYLRKRKPRQFIL